MKTFKTYISEKLQDLQQFNLLSDVTRPRTVTDLWRTLDSLGYEDLGEGHFAVAITGDAPQKSKRYVIKVSKPGDGLSGKDGWVDWGKACMENFGKPFFPPVYAIYPFYPQDYDASKPPTPDVVKGVKEFKYGYYAVLDYLQVPDDDSENVSEAIIENISLYAAVRAAWESEVNDDLKNNSDAFNAFMETSGWYLVYNAFSNIEVAVQDRFGLRLDFPVSYLGVDAGIFYDNLVELNPGLDYAFKTMANIIKSKKHGMDLHSGNWAMSEDVSVSYINDPFSWKHGVR